MRSIPLPLLAVALAGLLVLFALSGGDPPGEAPAPPDETAEGDGPLVSPPPPPEAEGMNAEDDPEGAPEEARPPVLTGRVVSETGRPVPSATAVFGGRKVRPGTVVLSVRDLEGQPLSGVALVARTWRDDEVRARGVTGSTGEASLENVLPGVLNLTALKPGYVQIRLASRGDNRRVLSDAGPLFLRVLPGGESRIDVTMARIAGLCAVVQDPEGRPLEGVVVSMASPAVAKTRGDGRFELDTMPRGVVVPLRFAREGFVTGQATAEPGVDEEMRLVLHPGATLSGRVLDDLEQPLASIQVTLSGGQDWLPVETDPSGAFSFTGLRSGAYSLVAEKDGFVPSHRSGIELRRGESREDLVLRLVRGLDVTLLPSAPGGGTVRAVVIAYGPMDRPDDERLHLRRDSGDDSGAVFCLLPGRYRIMAAPAEDVEDAGGMEVTMDLTTEGEVRLALPGTPRRIAVRLPGGTTERGSLRVHRTKPGLPQVDLWSGFGRRRRDGLLRSPALPPGKYDVRVFHKQEDGNSWRVTTFENVEPGGAPLEVE